MDFLKFAVGVSSLVMIFATFMTSVVLTKIFWSAANHFLFK
jgi:hypothetical protein